MSCPKGGDKVEWAHIHQLAADADALIDTLSVTGVTLLADSDEIPFKFASLPLYTDWIQFDLTPTKDGWTVHSNRLVTDWDTPWIPEDADLYDALVDDAAQGLYLVDNEGECWCTLHWKVHGSSDDAYSLREDEEAINTGCCPTTHCPEEGDDLTRTLPHGAHNFMPVGRMLEAERRSFRGNDPKEVLSKRCHSDESDEKCKLWLEKRDGKWRVTKVMRRLKGYFTWRIAGKQFQAITDNLSAIVEASCGPLEDDTIVAAGFDCETGKLTKRCPVTLEDILWTMSCDEDENFDCPGAITCVADSSETDGCGGVKVTMPWDAITNEAETCGEEEKTKVYRVVIAQFTDIIKKISGTLSPQQENCPCPDCNIEINAQEGFYGSCGILSVRAQNTPTEFEREVDIDVGCYAYQVLDIGISVTAEELGIGSDPSADCKAKFDLTCKVKTICSDVCRGCHPANNEDSTGTKKYPNGCENGEYKGQPGETWEIDFREDCCHGAAACECSEGGEAPPS